MKLKITMAILATSLAACTATPEMIEAQKARCTQVGWKPGTPEHAQCVERGTFQQQQMQNAAAGAAGSAAAGAAIGALFY